MSLSKEVNKYEKAREAAAALAAANEAVDASAQVAEAAEDALKEVEENSTPMETNDSEETATKE